MTTQSVKRRNAKSMHQSLPFRHIDLLTTSTLIGIAVLFIQASSLAQGPPPPPPPPPPPGPVPPVPVPTENPITESKRVLGKILFWDEQLSSDNTMACGTCHIPSSGGADPRIGQHPGLDGVFSTDDDVFGSPGIVHLDASLDPVNDPIFGTDPQVTGRAAQSYFMNMFSDDNFWDGRATSEFIDPEDGITTIIASGGGLESQAVGPILSSVEMAHAGRTWNDVRTKLQSAIPLLYSSDIPADMEAAVQTDPTYSDLFESAFGDSAITAARIGMAIATYERTLVANETPWDDFNDGNNAAMTANQIAGWEFLRDESACLRCHRPPLFTDDNFHNIGLRPSDEDFGREAITGQVNDRGRFKTPSLRNIGLRATLMHVGWVTSVQDAIEFYTERGGHVQFTDDQSGVPTNTPGVFTTYNDINLPETGPGGEPIQAQVIDFLVNGLTAPRVANETAPFDRPTLYSEMDRESEIFCDFAYDGMENGTQPQPYDTVQEALLHTASGGTIELSPGSTSETLSIDQPVTLNASGAAVMLGN